VGRLRRVSVLPTLPRIVGKPRKPWGPHSPTLKFKLRQQAARKAFFSLRLCKPICRESAM